MTEETRCDACGKLIDRLPEENTEDQFHTFNPEKVVGISIRMLCVNDEYIKRQMGEYSSNRDYNICYECLLRSLGVKP